jgi:methyltransferase
VSNSTRTGALLLALIFVPMALEAMRARRNERLQLARGGREPHGDVYELMRIAYPAVFIAIVAEGWLRGFADDRWVTLGVICFVSAKLLKYWAIGTLGRSWTFRVIVVPGGQLVSEGPYRYLRHPNYVAVIGELVGMAMLAGAPVAGVAGTTVFALLIARRVRVERAALDAGQAGDVANSPKNHRGRTQA